MESLLLNLTFDSGTWAKSGQLLQACLTAAILVTETDLHQVLSSRSCLLRWTPHPVIVIIRDNRDYIRVLFYSYYTTIKGWRDPPNSSQHKPQYARIRTPQILWKCFACLGLTGGNAKNAKTRKREKKHEKTRKPRKARKTQKREKNAKTRKTRKARKIRKMRKARNNAKITTIRVSHDKRKSPKPFAYSML